MKIVIIKRHETESWSVPPPVFVAAAANEDAAMKWIQDEVDGNHNSGHSYMQGKSAEWWIGYGAFSLTEVEVQQ